MGLVETGTKRTRRYKEDEAHQRTKNAAALFRSQLVLLSEFVYLK